MLLVYALSRSGGRTEVVTLILTGIAVNAFAGALIGPFIFFADTAQITQITFWQLGSLAQATWPKVLAVLPCAIPGLVLAPFYARKLDLLALGERPARHLGVDVERLRMVLVLVAALLTTAAVAVAGIISFVGLLVPHLLRMANGPGHRFLVPGRNFFAVRSRRLPVPVSPGDPVAEARGLRVRPGGRPVLDSIDLTAHAGEVLAPVGPNGAGKSTLLAALAADLPADSGAVRIDGRPVTEWSAPEPAPLRRAVLPQSTARSFPFPVEDVVRMGRATVGRHGPGGRGRSGGPGGDGRPPR